MAAILELDEHLQRDFTVFEAAPQVGLVMHAVPLHVSTYCVGKLSNQ